MNAYYFLTILKIKTKNPTFASTISIDASIFCNFVSKSINFVSQLIANLLRNDTVFIIKLLTKAKIRLWSIGGT